MFYRFVNIFQNRSFRLSIYSAIIPIAIQIVYVRYASYYIEKEIFGEFVLLMAAISGVSGIILITPLSALDRFYHKARLKKKFVDGINTLVLLYGVLGSLFLITYVYIRELDNLYYLLVLVILYLDNRASLNKSILQISLDRGGFFYSSVADKVSRMLLPIIFYYLFQTVESLILGYLLGTLILSLYTSYLSGLNRFKFIYSKYKFKFYFKYTYPIILVTASSWVISLSDRFMIDFFTSIEQVAIYSIYSSAAGFSSLFGGIFTIYVYPLILKQYSSDKKGAIKRYNNYLFIVAIAMVVGLMIIIFVIPEQIFYILINPDFLVKNYDWQTFYFLIFASMMVVFQTISSYYFALYKKNLIFSMFWLIAAIINVVLNIIFIPIIGIMAAALSTICAYIFLLSVSFYWLFKNKKISL